jgi:hypothetical protein
MLYIAVVREDYEQASVLGGSADKAAVERFVWAFNLGRDHHSVKATIREVRDLADLSAWEG